MQSAGARGEGGTVARQVPTGDIHHLRLTVTDIERSRQFYTSLLGFEVAVESPPPGDPSAAEVFKVLFGGVVMIRGNLLMALSNKFGWLVLTTGNKSEMSVGYSTLYGDSAGGFGPLKDVLKTLVWELARWRNAEAVSAGQVPPIPENSITKPPSAELAPGQMDTDSLPPYEVLDALLDDYVEKDMGTAELIAAGHDPALVERVVRMVDAAEYKRRQYPPGPKISQKNFGRDRRLPITSRWREHCGP